MEIVERGAIHLGSGAGRRLWVLGDLVTYKVTAGQTGGAYSLFEISTRPRCGPPPHIQHREDECFFVLEGEYEFRVGEEAVRAEAGALIYVPRGTVHAFENVGTDAGRLLVSQTPGGSQETFFEEIGEPAVEGQDPPAAAGQPDILDLMEIAARYGVEILPLATKRPG